MMADRRGDRAILLDLRNRRDAGPHVAGTRSLSAPCGGSSAGD
jgi:hypothetical protein